MIQTNPVSRSNLRQGSLYMLIGLVWGLVVPAAPFPRLALGAHIQLTTHGLMFLVGGLVIPHLLLGSNGIASRILIAAPRLTWLVMLSEMANGWWGTAKTLPIAAAQAGATGGTPWQESLVAAAHVGGALVLITYWGVILVDLSRNPTTNPGEVGKT
jgi:hydroxylaminobenzene mutase